MHDLKFGREEKLFASPQRRRKTISNQSQLEQVEVWIQENPNITIEEQETHHNKDINFNILEF